MIKPLNEHYSFTNPASVLDEEALTALELAGRTAYKVNEIIKDQNALRTETEDYNEKTRNEILPEEVKKAYQERVNDGTFDHMINEYIGNLEERLNGILGSMIEGSTTMDMEIVDARTGADGTIFSNLGNAVRNALNMGNLVESGNYETKLPDANQIIKPMVYVLHFAEGETNIPANLPMTCWHGRIGLLMTFTGTYNRQVYIDDHKIMTRNGTRTDNWSEWVALNKPTYIIDINGHGDYSSILKALKQHPTNTRFIIKEGEYDIRQQYMNVYGDTFFSTYNGYAGNSDVMTRGLFLGDGVELIGEGYVELLWNYPYDNEKVRQYFSVISTSQNNVLENLHITIEKNSCRYIIHDDYATSGGTNVFRNLVLKGHSKLSTAIGGGFGLYNTYVIENCVFVDGEGGINIAYHNNVEDAKNTLWITDCHCDGSIYLKHYGTSEQNSKAYVTGCEYQKIEVIHGDAQNYPNENIELVEWHNNLSGGSSKMNVVNTAKKGQLILVHSVDENGKPVEFETVDRTHYVDTVNVTTPILDAKTYNSQAVGYGGTLYLEMQIGKTYIVTWNGAEYECVCREHDIVNHKVIGGQGEPFTIHGENGSSWVTIEPNVEVFPMTVKIDRLDGVKEVVHKLDAKYMPDGLSAGGSSNEMYDVLPPTSLDFGEDGMCEIPTYIVATAGETYDVIWNDETYTCVAIESVAGDSDDNPVTMTAIGNIGALSGGESSNEPFVIIFDGRAIMIIGFDDSSSVTLSIRCNTLTTIKTLIKTISFLRNDVYELQNA